MKRDQSTLPKITAKFEPVTPDIAESWIATMVPNRKLKDSTVASYANDMTNGDWLLSPQGIAFDDAGRLFDGQHRLRAVIRAGVAVNLLVLRGFPARQDKMATMDVIDCGVGRSMADRLKLMNGEIGNPNLVCAVGRALIGAVIGHNRRKMRKPSLAVVLDVIDIWKDEIKAMCSKADRPESFSQLRNAEVVAALVLASAVCPKKTTAALDKLKTGADMSHDSPLLELRNAFIGGRIDTDRGDRLAVVLSAVMCEWMGLKGRAIHRMENKEAAMKHIMGKQQERTERVERLFSTKDAETTTTQPA